MDKNTRKVLKEIGRFFLWKNKFDYAKAELEIFRLYISAIKVETISAGLVVNQFDKVTITLGRPGMLIGPQGKTIAALQNWLKVETDCKQVLIVEDRECFLDAIIPNKQFAGDEPYPALDYE